MAYPQTTFHQTNIIEQSLVGRRRRAVVTNTLQYQLDVLKKTGRYDAFKLKWHAVYDQEPEVWPVPNALFWDSDVAKWIEGACYVLKQEKIPAISAAVDELVDMIRSAQQPDGYLNIHYTVVEPGKRFTNLMTMHEMYNAGHLIEAALAHQDVYQNEQLMEPIIKYVDLLCDTFGPHSDQTPGYPGHPEIELALLRLYDRTHNPRHLQLASFFLTERGNPTGCDGRHYYDVEAQRRGDDPAKRPAYYPEPRCMWYHQAHAPIAEQTTIEGHSVRAMYLLTAVADVLRDESKSCEHIRPALYTLWHNMVGKKMYVTGGIGAMKQWEGFGQNFFLPQGTPHGGCYSETCAAIGVMMLANRILQIDLDSQFADIMELCLYNAVLTSMSHDGKAFTYVNQLASSTADPSKREEWFTVACCPPNVLRFLGQIGGYIWDHQYNDATQEVEVNVHLYIPATITISPGTTIKQTGDWPWNSEITFEVESSAKTSVKLRIPEWAQDFQLNPPCSSATSSKGYLTLPAEWISGHPRFTLSLPLKPRWLTANPATGQNVLSLARGPVIYCVEDVDNTWVEDHFEGLCIDSTAELTEQTVKDSTTGDKFVGICLKDGAVAVQETVTSRPFVELASRQQWLQQAQKISELHFVPYYFRANRGGEGQMRVGLHELHRTEIN